MVVTLSVEGSTQVIIVKLDLWFGTGIQDKKRESGCHTSKGNATLLHFQVLVWRQIFSYSGWIILYFSTFSSFFFCLEDLAWIATQQTQTCVKRPYFILALKQTSSAEVYFHVWNGFPIVFDKGGNKIWLPLSVRLVFHALIILLDVFNVYSFLKFKDRVRKQELYCLESGS